MVSLFRRGPSRKTAAAFVEKVRGVVALITLSRADVSVAETLLEEAEIVKEREPAKAVELAQRAERLAATLEADHAALADATAKLGAVVERMESLSIPAAEERKVLEEVEARTTATREFEGLAVPDYRSAAQAVGETLARAEATVALFDGAEDAIFAAELAIDGAVEPFGSEDVEALQEAREMLRRARAQADAGSFDLAATDAGIAERLALAVVEQRRRAEETLANVERVVNGLKAIGIRVAPVAHSLEIGRTLLTKGKLAAAIDVLNEAAQEAVALGNSYRQALDSLSGAMAAIEALRTEGLSSPEAEAALGRAKVALRDGNYSLAFACTEDVHREVRRSRETRDGLRALIEETKARVEELRGMDPEFVNDVEEMVARAEVEFANGDFASTSEDLRIASLLMAPAFNDKDRPQPQPQP